MSMGRRPSLSPDTDTWPADAVLDAFGEALVDFVARADRSRLTATLFDVPKRTELSMRSYAEHGPDLVRAILDVISPEELGAAMRRPAARPNPMHVSGLPYQMLLERERRLMLDLSPLPADDDLRLVLEFVGRTNRAATREVEPFPAAATAWRLPLLDEDQLAPLVENAQEWSEEDRAALRRLVASLELYAFMLHGEHRDGIFEHGPYELPSGELVMCKDFTDLRNDFLPWSTPEVRLAHPAISVTFVLDRACAPRVNLWGTAEFEAEPWDHLSRVGIMVVDAGSATPLPAEDWSAVGSAARQAQKEIFMAVASWAPEERTRYGMWLFLNHLQSIARAAGAAPQVVDELVASFTRTSDEAFEAVTSGGPSPVWAVLRRDHPFSPLGET